MCKPYLLCEDGRITGFKHIFKFLIGDLSFSYKETKKIIFKIEPFIYKKLSHWLSVQQ